MYQDVKEIADTLEIDTKGLTDNDLSELKKATKIFNSAVATIDIIANTSDPSSMTVSETAEMFSKVFSLAKSFNEVPGIGPFLDYYQEMIDFFVRDIRYIEDQRFETNTIRLVGCGCCCNDLIFYGNVWDGIIGEVVVALDKKE
jgi:hypothetical protein